MSILGCPYCGLNFGHTLLCPANIRSDVATEREALNPPTAHCLYTAERERAEREHPASEWANKTPDEMFSDLFNEVSELGIAVEADDLHGPHGVLIEALHVRIVAERIAEEMVRREG